MRLRAVLAGILVAMVLSGASFGPVCQACTEAAQVLACQGHSAHEMQSAGMHSGKMQAADGGSTRMAGMPNCAACGSRGSLATALVGPCGHEAVAEVRALGGNEGSAAVQAAQSERGIGYAVTGPLTVARFSLAEPPGSGIASPISLHTTLRV